MAEFDSQKGVEPIIAQDLPKYGLLEGCHNAEERARSKRLGMWQRHGGKVRPWPHRDGGVLTPIEFMQAKEEEEAKAQGDARIMAPLGEQA